MMSKVNSSEFSVVDVRVTAIVVITVPSPVAVTALSLDYECVICVFVMGDSSNWIKYIERQAGCYIYYDRIYQIDNRLRAF